MASIKAKFTVGLFVILGLGIAIVAVIWIGMSHYFEGGRYYVSYFDESVQGLDKDSPVKYRGVSIGRVENISVAPDAALIQVVLKIESGLESGIGDIVAQLKSVGITGIMFVELERKIVNVPVLSPPLSFTPKYPVIATKPSGSKQLMDNINEIFGKLSVTDITGIANNLRSTLDKISKEVEEAKVKEISSGIRLVLSRFEKILDVEKLNRVVDSTEKATKTLDTLSGNAQKTFLRLDNLISDNEKDLTEAVHDFKDSVKRINSFMESGNNFVKGTDSRINSLQRHLLVTAQNLEKVSENLDRLIEIASDHPPQIFFGEQLPGKKIEPD